MITTEKEKKRKTEIFVKLTNISCEIFVIVRIKLAKICKVLRTNSGIWYYKY